MKTREEYKEILETTKKKVEQYFPNWRLVTQNENFASIFSRCLPLGLTYEDIAVICFMFHEKE